METKRIYFLEKVIMELKLARGGSVPGEAVLGWLGQGLGLKIMRHDAVWEA